MKTEEFFEIWGESENQNEAPVITLLINTVAKAYGDDLDPLFDMVFDIIQKLDAHSDDLPESVDDAEAKLMSLAERVGYADVINVFFDDIMEAEGVDAFGTEGLEFDSKKILKILK